MSTSDRPSRQLTRFERQVIGLMIAGTNEASKILQAQLDVAEVVRRSSPGMTGFGLEFVIPDYVPRLPQHRSKTLANLGGLVIGQSGSETDCFFLLHIEGGEICMLEIIGSGAPWPEHPRLIAHWYSEVGRDGVII